jgi:hypothetical protein
MFPASYQIPALVLFTLGGLLTCLFGYRMFRLVLAVYGFILGALFANSLVAVSGTAATVLVAVVGGIVGSLVLVAAYFVGVALVGAGLGALVAHALWAGAGGEPHVAVVVAAAVIGAIGAMIFQRYIIIVGTAFGGAWMVVAGALGLLGNGAARDAVTSGRVWLTHPLDIASDEGWVMVAWGVVAIVGVLVQMQQTSTQRRRRRR